jgi:hypothetical protein
MMPLTSLSATQSSDEEVVRLYRMRCQVELAFSRLKGVGFVELRAANPRLACSWLLAHLIVVILIETPPGEALDSTRAEVRWHHTPGAPSASMAKCPPASAVHDLRSATRTAAPGHPKRRPATSSEPPLRRQSKARQARFVISWRAWGFAYQAIINNS